VKNHPVEWAFYMLRKSAKRRFLPFTLSLKYFRKWVKGTDYMELKGRNGDDMTIDRMKPELGYVAGNLQVMTRTNNLNKYWDEEKEKELEEVEKDDLPF
jgi:hypothetical protein